jgi:glycosyltransferase involved in cell wall biosynthesis
MTADETPPRLTKLDGRPTPLASDEIIALTCVRNEVLRLPSFLEHHRKLGIGRFFVVDNGSEDGTTELLLAQPDVHIFATEESYAASSCGTAWINDLASRFGVGHWVLTVDADELFVYPDYERADLHVLTTFLDQAGSESMVGLLLDMYSAADLTGVLLHFKFLSDFPQRTRLEAARGEHWCGATEADVGVAERRDHLRLAVEALADLLVLGESGREHLDRDLPVEARVARPPDLAHPARSGAVRRSRTARAADRPRGPAHSSSVRT